MVLHSQTCMACLGCPGYRVEPCGFCGGNQAADANAVPEVWKDCDACGGEGHTLHSRYGGNDPDVWSVRCEACAGAGGFICEAEGVSRC